MNGSARRMRCHVAIANSWQWQVPIMFNDDQRKWSIIYMRNRLIILNLYRLRRALSKYYYAAVTPSDKKAMEVKWST